MIQQFIEHKISKGKCVLRSCTAIGQVIYADNIQLVQEGAIVDSGSFYELEMKEKLEFLKSPAKLKGIIKLKG